MHGHIGSVSFFFCFSLPFKSHGMRTSMGLLLLDNTPSGFVDYYI